eukprot:gene5333-5365_t
MYHMYLYMAYMHRTDLATMDRLINSPRALTDTSLATPPPDPVLMLFHRC